MGTEGISKSFEEAIKELTCTFEKIQREAIKNRCWWDMRVCPYYTEIKGLQEASSFCSGCSQVEQDRFVDLTLDMLPAVCQEKVAKEILEEEMKELKEDSIEEGKKIGRKEAEEEFRRKFREDIKQIMEILQKFIPQ